MKLFIKRDQKVQKGLFGTIQGMVFELSYRLELTPEESALVTKYQFETYPLGTVQLGNDTKIMLTLYNLKSGDKLEEKDIFVLFKNEKSIIKSCESFKMLLDAMATYGGEEIIDF